MDHLRTGLKTFGWVFLGLLLGFNAGVLVGNRGDVAQLRHERDRALEEAEAARVETLGYQAVARMVAETQRRRAERAVQTSNVYGVELPIAETASLDLPTRNGWTVRETSTYRGWYKDGKPVGSGTVFYHEGQRQADQFWGEPGRLAGFVMYDRRGQETAHFDDGTFRMAGKVVEDREVADTRRGGLVLDREPWTAEEAWKAAMLASE